MYEGPLPVIIRRRTAKKKTRSGACKRDLDREINPAFVFDVSVLQFSLLREKNN